MSVKKITRWIGFLAVFACGMMAFSQTAAAEDELWLRWDIEADLTIGEPDVRLIVETGFYDEQGAWQLAEQQNIPLVCEVNNVEFSEGGPAVFSGDGYIACEMVNIVKIATDMSGGEFDFPEKMGGSGTNITAELSLDGYGNDNPVFYHPDIQFHAVNVGEAYLDLEVGGLTASSSEFMPTSQQSLYGALGQSNDTKVHYPEFAVNGKSLDATPNVLYGHSLVSNVYENMIYIGYSPVTDTYFEGEIFSIDVDPGCSGYG